MKALHAHGAGGGEERLGPAVWESIPSVHAHHGPEGLLVSEKDEGTFIGPLLRNGSRCGEEVSVAQRWAIARVPRMPLLGCRRPQT